jgi:hypothetical protein
MPGTLAYFRNGKRLLEGIADNEFVSGLGVAGFRFVVKSDD